VFRTLRGSEHEPARVPIGRVDNEKFLRIKDIEPEGNRTRLFFNFDFVPLKELNDTVIRDKTLVTNITHYAHLLFLENMAVEEQGLAKYPHLKALHDQYQDPQSGAAIYRGFKEMMGAIEYDPGEVTRSDLVEELHRYYEDCAEQLRV